ncbi:MAG: hypothetical protein KR126chlam1_00505 [Chlamydiae bacterium]|nr:hypothetical protein [Chlamydiota bacterium]
MEKKLIVPLAALSILGLANVANAASIREDGCCETPQAACHREECDCFYCLGPDQVNPPVRPKTCNGDIGITIAGFYWNAHQDGMEYAIEDSVLVDDGSTSDILRLNNLVKAHYETPDFKWDFGFKAGLTYVGCHDGWDFGLLWTWYRGKSGSTIQALDDHNSTLIPLWSAFSSETGLITYATEIEENWAVQLQLFDIELGREFWTSKYLSLRPHVGLRIAFIDQEFNLVHRGGSWSDEGSNSDAFNGFVDLDNDYRGVGIRAGLDSVWHIGCGWGLFGNFATSIVYGRFKVDHDEWNRKATDPHSKIKILETQESFHASRAMLDLVLGVQWSTMFCDCCYGFTMQLGWEHHVFFDQNQMWRVVRIGDTSACETGETPKTNSTGENVFQQRRGDLDTQGWTLTLKFEF